ncbi:ASCH domain-containing protein [Streptomyces sp. NPDC058650]|uniref:ASCH domain-containing protein n=1 Tax=Streptomyces sp. NPDC058650 TaxID=3346575 RepID=UPI00364D3C76
MRVLTVRQPWAWAIIHGGKDVENRVRNIAGGYRGPVAIHAGLAPIAWDDVYAVRDVLGRDAFSFGSEGWRGAHGRIIGVVDLVDVHLTDSAECYSCEPWAEPFGWHLVLANPRPLAEPIPFRGALGLRRLDDPTRLLVESELAP